MAISIYSCLKHPSPPALPPPLLPKLTPLAKISIAVVSPCSPEKKEFNWRIRCVSTAACVILGSTIGLGSVGSGGEGEALAGEVRAVGGAQAKKVMRWSDVRKCPPWHANSLENIVPENLPRPSDGRRSNRLAAYGQHVTAPPVGVGASMRYRSSCFSL
ncbi:hypothetical protein Cni_G04498 [Canna indica]|uniref:Uncharacterized protein n=1 Tax=Canna indica TaxID=4628 RepID=A0AAQ3JTP2_9LILI|nr:hypothetical protein Cni_G04498 [Canna indica]